MIMQTLPGPWHKAVPGVPESRRHIPSLPPEDGWGDAVVEVVGG